MFEVIGGLIGIGLLLWVMSESGGGSKPRYTIERTEDVRFYEVRDSDGNTMFVGTEEQCSRWIEDKEREG